MQSRVTSFIAQLGSIIYGKEEAIRLAVATLLARGHLLIEDVPGVGKTTLSQTLAKSLGLEFRRIQFTSDLLPADILGNSIYDKESQRFVFHAGPVFAPVVLIDEVNRATPKTQSALLEAMEENQISVDGVTYPLPKPFFVVATQNPINQIGTFPLPESQLDRFMMRIQLGFPDRASERELLQGADRRDLLRTLKPVLQVDELREMQEAVPQIFVSAALLDYIQNLLFESRRRYPPGLSPRAGLTLLRAAKAWAYMTARDMVLPEDIQAVAISVMGHRLVPSHGGNGTGPSGADLARDLVETVPVD